MGTCCGYVNQKQDKEATLTLGSNREREVQDALDRFQKDQNDHNARQQFTEKLEEDGDAIHTQRSLIFGSLLQQNLHSVIQNYGTMDPDENEKYKKEFFYGAEAVTEYEDHSHDQQNVLYQGKELDKIIETDQIRLEVMESKKMTKTQSKEIQELERKISDIPPVSQENIQQMDPKEKDTILLRASSQFEQQSTLLKLQQVQLIQQQQLLEKQQLIIQQQMIVQHAQTKAPLNTQTSIKQVPSVQNSLPSITMNSDKTTSTPKQQQIQVPPTIQCAPPSPKQKVIKQEQELLSETASVQSADKPRSIIKHRNNVGTANDLNISFESDANSQSSQMKKKVKFKESAFKKITKKKQKGGVIIFIHS